MWEEERHSFCLLACLLGQTEVHEFSYMIYLAQTCRMITEGTKRDYCELHNN
eukprot:COSAG06_NODE_4517_length_4188_cov_1.672536_4_plen_52_part_00